MGAVSHDQRLPELVGRDPKLGRLPAGARRPEAVQLTLQWDAKAPGAGIPGIPIRQFGGEEDGCD